MADLRVNTARLSVQSFFEQPVEVLWQSDECYKCPLSVLFTLFPGTNDSAVLSTLYSSTSSIRSRRNETLNCEIPSLQNQAEYLVQIFADKSCNTTVITEASNEYHPLMAVFLVQLLLSFLWRLGRVVWKRNFPRERVATVENAPESTPSGTTAERAQQSDSGSRNSSTASILPQIEGRNLAEQQERANAPVKRRLQSLDSFRGLSLFLMIFVNYGGGKLAIFEHSPWNGLTIADLVFPWFIWIMGVSLAITMRSLRRRMIPTREIFGKIVTRSVKLIVLGLVLNSYGGHNDYTKLRIPGVLQRFGVSYFVVATLHLLRATPTDPDVEQRSVGVKTRDILYYWPEWLVMICLVSLQLALTFALPVPGCPKGYVGPGGLHMGGAYANCTGGAAGYIDRLILTNAHIYQRNTAHEIYHGNVPFDPEGLLGCLTSIFLTFLGLQAGKILITYREAAHRVSRWIMWAAVCGIAAGVLCGFSKEDGFVPINKNLWSMSFVLCNACFAFIVLTVMYIVIDIGKLWSGKPFTFLGMNSILVYVGHLMVTGMLPWFWSGPESHYRYLIMNLSGTYLWTLTAYILHKNKIYAAL